MSVEVVVDWALLAVLFAVALWQSWLTLRRTACWDALGRAYLLYFAGKAVLWGYAIAIRLHDGPPDADLRISGARLWLLWAIRAELIATGLLLIWTMARYQWPEPPDRIGWGGLLSWPWPPVRWLRRRIAAWRADRI